MVHEGDYNPEHAPIITAAEVMYNGFFSYQNILGVLRLFGTGGLVLSPSIKDDEGKVYAGDRLVKHYFDTYTDKKITLEQATKFSPFFFMHTICEINTAEFLESDQYEQVENIFNDPKTKNAMESMFDKYFKIEPYLLQELDKLYELHPELKENHRVQFDDLRALIFPYIELPENKLEPLFEKCRNKEIVSSTTDKTGVTLTVTYHQYFEYVYAAVKAAKQAVTSKMEPEEQEELLRRDLIPSVTSLALQSIGYPTDKVNCHLWGNLRIGKQTILKAESDRDRARGKRADIIVMLNFEELDGVKISRPLTSYDKRVFIAAANLVNEGQYILTPTQIYRAMGSTTKPSQADKEKILESLSVLVRARVFIDNTTEAKLYGYDRIKGDFALLKADIVAAFVDGQLTEGTLEVAEVPKLFQFSIDREQITTVPIKLLESPISKTKANLTLEDYLIRRISQMNNPNKKVPNKILLSTLYEQCGITDRKQRSRLVNDKLPKLLEHYVKTGYIKSYTLDDKSITIISPTQK